MSLTSRTSRWKSWGKWISGVVSFLAGTGITELLWNNVFAENEVGSNNFDTQKVKEASLWLGGPVLIGLILYGVWFWYTHKVPECKRFKLKKWVPYALTAAQGAFGLGLTVTFSLTDYAPAALGSGAGTVICTAFSAVAYFIFHPY